MDNKLYKLMNWPRVEGIIYSEEDNPHEILGPHAVSKNTLFQTFQPEAEEVYLILSDQKKKKMEQVDEAGFFACLMPGRIPDQYEYEVHYDVRLILYIHNHKNYNPILLVSFLEFYQMSFDLIS